MSIVYTPTESYKKCWICGGIATKKRNLMEPISSYGWYRDMKPIKDDHQRCYCDKCYEETMKTLHDDNLQYVRLKKKKQFEKAIDRLEHQGMDLYKYKEAIDTVYEYTMEHDDKFDSSYEVIAAIILIHNHIHIKPQFKIGRYQVDFLLDEEHIVLEIDGERHKHRKVYDNQRDNYIKQQLGKDWEIIRINTDCLDMKAEKLVKAIDEVLDYRDSGRINWRTL